MTVRLVVTEDFTLDPQNWRRYGEFFRAGHIYPNVRALDAAAIVRAGAGRLLDGPARPMLETPPAMDEADHVAHTPVA